LVQGRLQFHALFFKQQSQRGLFLLKLLLELLKLGLRLLHVCHDGLTLFVAESDPRLEPHDQFGRKEVLSQGVRVRLRWFWRANRICPGGQRPVAKGGSRCLGHGHLTCRGQPSRSQGIDKHAASDHRYNNPHPQDNPLLFHERHSA